MPAPLFGSAKYATCTYPLDESTAIAGAGRPQPAELWSVESAMTMLESRLAIKTPLESGRTSHQAENSVAPTLAVRVDAGHASGDPMLAVYSFGC
jgi:hypothetical protein